MSELMSGETVANESKRYAKFDVAVAVDDGLRQLSGRTSLRSYFSRLWSRRYFIVADARSRAFSTNDDMYLGRAWYFLDPIFQIALYALLFGYILNTSRGIENFIGYLIIGIIFFGFLTKGLSSGQGLVRSSRNLISAFDFPRASVVFGSWLRGMLASIVPSIIAVIGALLTQADKPLSWTIILVLPIWFILQIFILGLIFVSARATAFVPDATKIVGLFGRVWFFISGVFFSIDRYARIPEIQAVMETNPAYRFLRMIRDVVMYASAPSLAEWLYVILWAVGLLMVGFFYFWSAESRYARIQ